MSPDNLVQRALRLLNQPSQAAAGPTIQAGTSIEWDGRGRVHRAIVDYIHVDDTGIRSVFVTLPDGSWAALNSKFVRIE